uniref:Microsomal glutathione S-transferase 1 n=1 Tax=Culicoides sonorensis TaxID=179676 RepID=A0A336M143_CULSO
MDFQSNEILNSESFKCYAFWSGILVLKMVFMSVLTGLQRFRKKAFSNPEDLILINQAQIKFDDDDVERARRAHRNDLETILPFLIIGYLYVLTKPNETAACYLFRIAGICRLIHTLVYSIIVVRQPARGIAFWGTTGIMIYMAVVVMVHFYS